MALHLDVNEQDLKLIDHPGQLPNNTNAPLVKYNYETVRPGVVSEKVIELIKDALVAGAQLKRYQYPTGEIREKVECPKPQKQALIRQLDMESGLAVFREPKDRPVFAYATYDTFHMNSWDIANALLLDALKRRNPALSLQAFNQYLLKETALVREVHAIDGLRVEREIELLPGVKLVPSNSVAYLETWKGRFGNPADSIVDRSPTGALCIETEQPNFFVPGPDAPEQTIDGDKLFEVLPIIGPTPISSILSFRTADVWFVSNSGGGYRYSTEAAPAERVPYIPDFSEFEELYRAYVSLPEKCATRVAIALQRIRHCTRGRNLTDRCLDLGIALESVLLSGKDEDGTSGEISFRLASRGAWYLGANAAERYRIFGILRSAYKLRSNAAHTGKVPNLTKTVHKGEAPMPTLYLFRDALELCCEAVKKVVRDGKIPRWTQMVLGFDQTTAVDERNDSKSEVGLHSKAV